MPTYEYRCPEGHEFELMQKMSDRPRAKCPVCGRPAARQMSGGAALIFKGSGFYITDYRSEGYKDAAKKESTAGSESTGKSGEKKAETKPASSTKGESKKK